MARRKSDSADFGFKTVSISELRDALDVALVADVPVMIWGPGGIGKSSVVFQAAATYGGDFKDIRTNLREPVDFMGVPSVTNGKTHFNPPADMFNTNNNAKGVLLLDELPNAQRATQSALYQLVLKDSSGKRSIGEASLPDGWRIVAAGNRLQDHGGVFEMPLPLKERFVHFELEVNAKEWLAWAQTNNIHPSIRAFIERKPENLYEVDATRLANATPRTWDMLSKVVSACGGSSVAYSLVQGAIGEGPAVEYLAYLKTYHKLPSLKKLIAKPTLMDPYQDKPDVLYAVGAQLIDYIDSKTAQEVIPLLDHLPAEHQAKVIGDVTAVDPLMYGCEPIRKWIDKNGMYTAAG